jgi:hypothetical protein
VDLKSILATIFILTLAIVGYFYFYSPREKIDSASLTGRTDARVISIEPIDRMKQSRKGTNIYTESYKITYLYTIAGQPYKQSDNIQNIGRNELLLRGLLAKSAEDSVAIQFDETDPQKSILLRSGK